MRSMYETRDVRAEIARLLIKHGADVSVHDNTHSTPLHLAALSGSPDAVHLLLEHGENATILDGSQRTLLHLASAPVSVAPAYC